MKVAIHSAEDATQRRTLPSGCILFIKYVVFISNLLEFSDF